MIGLAHVIYKQATQMVNGEELGEKHLRIVLDTINSKYGKEKVPKGYTSAQSLKGGTIHVKDLLISTEPIDWPKKRLRVDPNSASRSKLQLQFCFHVYDGLQVPSVERASKRCGESTASERFFRMQLHAV